MDLIFRPHRLSLLLLLTLFSSLGFGQISTDIYWTNIVNVQVEDQKLTSTSSRDWDAGAFSANYIPHKYDGQVDYRVLDLETSVAFGLSLTDRDQGFSTIDYCYMLRDGHIEIFVRGNLVVSYGMCRKHDLLTISREGEYVNFIINEDNTLYSTREGIDLPNLYVDISLHSSGDDVEGIMLSSFHYPDHKVVWRNMEGVVITGNNQLEKTAVNGWENGGAKSVNTIPADSYGSVYLDYETTSYPFAIGLSIDNVGVSFYDCDYSICILGGTPYVFELGKMKASIGSLQNGDRMEIERSNGAIRYKINGSELYSTVVDTEPELFTDVCLYQQGFTLSPAYCSFPAQIKASGSYDLDQESGNSILTVNVEGGTPPYNYEWSTGDYSYEQVSSIELHEMPYGEYDVTVCDASGDFDVIAIGILNPTPKSVATGEDTYGMNWVRSISYGAGGIVGDTKVYYDLFGKQLQTQSKILSSLTDKNLVTETLYDVLGRAVLSTLPAIVEQGNFEYKKGFITNYLGDDYDYDDFDNTTNISGSVNNPKKVQYNIPNTLGYYYSNNNTGTDGENYIAATNYPYSRVEYSNLNKGVVRRSSMAGDHHRMGKGHETWTFSMPASEDELEAIYAQTFHQETRGVSKTITIEPNGKQSVIYNNLQGNVVAACLVGGGTNITVQQAISPEIGYLDFHIVEGCESSIVISNSIINNDNLEFDIYDLSNDDLVSSSGQIAPANSQSINLAPGFYRVMLNEVSSEFPYFLENVSISYDINYSDHSLNFYNEIGQLKFTVSPLGLVEGSYSMYRYDAKGNLVWSSTPDAGVSQFIYRKDNQIRFSQNAQQLLEHKYSYSSYDQFGRVVEIGEYDYGISGSPIAFENPILFNEAGYKDLLINMEYAVSEVRCLKYDLAKITLAVGTLNSIISSITNNSDAIDDLNLAIDVLNNANSDNLKEKADLAAAFVRDAILHIDNQSVTYTSSATAMNGVIDLYKNVYDNTIDDGLDDIFCSQVTMTQYDIVDDFVSTYSLPSPDYESYEQRFVIGKISKTWTASTPTGSPDVITWYSYDEQGSIEWSVQRIEGMDNPATASLDERFKTMDYTYYVDGNVETTVYQKPVYDEKFKHYYEYDKDNRLEKVYTYKTSVQDNGGGPAEVTDVQLQAQYYYYPHGPLRRVELNEDLQGIDYVYNINGLLKSINHPMLDAPCPSDALPSGKIYDPGQDDGVGTNCKPDVFGMTIDYYLNDYYKKNSYISSGFSDKNRYDGNIKSVNWKTKDPALEDILATNGKDYWGYHYDYEKHNWLSEARFGTLSHDESKNRNSYVIVDPGGGLSADDGLCKTVLVKGSMKSWHKGMLAGEDLDPELLQMFADVKETIGDKPVVKASVVEMAIDKIKEVISRFDPYIPPAFATECMELEAELCDIYGNTIPLPGDPIDYDPGFTPSEEYHVLGIKYDKNGNLRYLKRNATAGEYGIVQGNFTLAMDDFDYDYIYGTNRLDRINDLHTTPSDYSDIKHGQLVGNYFYDAIGQQVGNDEEDMYFEYNAYGKVINVYKDDAHTHHLAQYDYDDKGNRYRKLYYNLLGVENYYEYYVRNMSGNIISTYTVPYLGNDPITQKDLGVFGASRLGTANISYEPGFVYSVGKYNYEMKDHLGTVRAVVSRNLSTGDADVDNFADHYPFGMVMPGRESTTAAYRHGFQGEFAEKDQETGYDFFELRLWDGRVGRWMSIDPFGQYHSPYLGMGNNPVNGIDPNGGVAWFPDANGNLIAEKGDNAITLAAYLNISQTEASQMINQPYILTTSPVGPYLTEVVEGQTLFLDNVFTRSIQSTDTKYNCWGSAINGTDGKELKKGSGIDIPKTFDELLISDFTNVSGSDMKFGESVIRFTSNTPYSNAKYDAAEKTGVLSRDPAAVGGALHGVAYYGSNRKGEIYVYTKDGWTRKPYVTKLSNVLKSYGSPTGLGTNTPYYNRN